ncbi:MAG: hypothetical protein IPK16_13865 [Anaerolineales bacterium]|nr:hypothetical protein [Anaerolineales bacterium]
MPYRMRYRHLIIEMIDRLTITIEPADPRTDEAMARAATGLNCEDGNGSSVALALDADSDKLDAGAEPNLELPGGESV